MIVFSSVAKEYAGSMALSGVSFAIAPGEFVCLTGPSGAGKSTIVSLLVREELPSSGSIEVDGANLAKLPFPLLQLYRRSLGVLFQNYRLLPDRTVAENIAYPLEVLGETDDLIQDRVATLLSRLKLTDKANAKPAGLSGGECTRLGLARALAHGPKILIVDEPTGNIDPLQSMEIVTLLKEIHATGTTVILATHDRAIVDALTIRVLRLEAGKLVRDSAGPYHAPNVIQAPEPTQPQVDGTPASPAPEAQAAAPVSEPAVPTEADAVEVHSKTRHTHPATPKHAPHGKSHEHHGHAAHEVHGKHTTKVKPISIDTAS